MPPAADTRDIELRSSVADRHHEDLTALFAAQWWTAGRSAAQLRGILEHSQVVVSAVHVPTDRLVGFARVVTDRTIVAVVLDVMVAEDWRGTGLGGRLMDTVLARPELAEVQSIELVCQPPLFGFYARWGFTEQVGGSRLMRRTSFEALLGPVPGG